MEDRYYVFLLCDIYVCMCVCVCVHLKFFSIYLCAHNFRHECLHKSLYLLIDGYDISLTSILTSIYLKYFKDGFGT